MRAIESFSDLDALVLACRDARSKELIAESISCYRAGAFRAAIVVTWIAVVFDFVHKLRELDARADKQARTLLERFEESRKNNDIVSALEFERNVLEHCEKFEFLSPVERTDLERLYQDRNRCAHPAMRAEDERYEPSPELCRLHIRNAVELMLGRPATQGKAALSALHDEVMSTLFPKDWMKARALLERGPLGRAKAVLVRGFLVSTVKRLIEDGVEREEAQRLSAALRATAAMYSVEFSRVANEPGFATPCSEACAKGRALKVLRLLALVPELREVVLDAVRVQLEQLLRRAADAELVLAIHDGLDVPQLENLTSSRIDDLDKKQLEDLIKMNPRREYAARGVQIYLLSNNYDQANDIAESIILPLVDFLDVAEAQKIAHAARQPKSQIGGGYRFLAVKTRLQTLGIWPLEPPA